MRWRSPVPEALAGGSLKGSTRGIEWQRWSRAALAEARAQGRPVLVDFTADWCLTCQANMRVAIDIPSVRAKLKQINAVALLGDYTRLPDDITAELNHFGRRAAGVGLSSESRRTAAGAAGSLDAENRAQRAGARRAVGNFGAPDLHNCRNCASL